MRYLVLAVSALLLALAATGQASAYPSDPKTGVTILDVDKVYPGYVLFTPYFDEASAESAGTIYLINTHGEVVHTWEKERKAEPYAQLLPNGNLMYLSRSEAELERPFTSGGLLQEIDWDGNVVWSYENHYAHHDFEVLPNGNIAVLIYQQIPGSLADLVQGGLPGEGPDDTSMWSDAIIEVDREGNILWTWNAWEHLDPAEDDIGPNQHPAEWTHANSLRYVEADPITGSEAYLVSFRQTSTVALVDRSTGGFIWKWGRGVLSYQHDARLLDSGNILIFDNGDDPRAIGPAQITPRSRVVEVDPREEGGKIVWQYVSPSFLGWRFLSLLGSGAHRLPNGNTLITEAGDGRIFEVTPENEIVWEYVSPYGQPMGDGPARETGIFKALKYSPDEIDWPETLPGPMERISGEEAVAPENGESEGAAPEGDLATAEDGSGDLTRWQGVGIGIGASIAFFVLGFLVARLVTGRRSA